MIRTSHPESQDWDRLTQKEMLELLASREGAPHPAIGVRWDDPSLATAKALRTRGLATITPCGGYTEEEAIHFVVRGVVTAEKG